MENEARILKLLESINEKINQILFKENPDKLLTISEAASSLNISVSTLYKWVEHRKIPFIKAGRSIRFDKLKIDNWINRRSIKGKAAP